MCLIPPSFSVTFHFECDLLCRRFFFSFVCFVGIFFFRWRFNAGLLFGVNFLVAAFFVSILIVFFLLSLEFAYICVVVARFSYHLHTHFTYSDAREKKKLFTALLWHQVSLDGYFFYLQYSTIHMPFSLFIFCWLCAPYSQRAQFMHWATRRSRRNVEKVKRKKNPT